VSVGYGAYFSHRAAKAEEHVYIGSYAIIGSATLERWALIGSRTSILSGGALHELDDQGRWLPSDMRRAVRVTVSAHAWIGEGSIIMADIGRGSLVAAGSVVSSPVGHGVVVGGNPARYVRSLMEKPLEPIA
jgi:acetyltransferase-like isoleucine patch superfamily enzyme